MTVGLKKFSDYNALSAAALRGDETVLLADTASTGTVTASTISATAATNTISDSGGGLPVVKPGALVLVSGFTDTAGELNALHTVVSSDVDNLVVTTDITVDEAAGSNVSVSEVKAMYQVPLGQLFGFDWVKGSDIASASALVLPGDGNYHDVTGSTAIDTISSTGRTSTIIKLHFDGILTLNHDPVNLVLPGAASITTAAGDEAEFVKYAADAWRCTAYQKANGEPVSGAGGGTTDFNAIHDNTASEISAITEKTTFHQDDYFIIEDSEASGAKKSQKAGTILRVEINAQTGTTYTLVVGDAYKLITMSNAASNTLTVPTNASEAFDVGTQILVGQRGAGLTTIVPDTGVNINGATGSIDLGGPWASVSLIYEGNDEWSLEGRTA